MDGNNFDNLTRSLAAGVSRRTILRRLVGGVSGGLLGALGAEAAAAGCSDAGAACGAGKKCCGGKRCLNGVCCPTDRVCGGACCPPGFACQGGVCVAPEGETPGGCPSGQGRCNGACTDLTTTANCGACGRACPAPPPCRQAACQNGACTTVPDPAQNDAACPGGICCNGACIAPCTASDQCHVAGRCNPATGQCSDPIAPNGTACDDGNACTQTDTCQGGSCVGSNPVVCTASDQCHDVGVCDHATGLCSNPAKADGTACSDGNRCTQTDTCQAGACTGANPIVCAAPDQCHEAGVCNPATGTCSNPAKPNGTSCNDNNACTRTDSCQGGACVGGNPVVCTALSQCHDAGTCNPATGQCSNPNKPDGTACDDHDAYTTGDTCQAGVCVGGCTPATSCPAGQTCGTAPDGCGGTLDCGTCPSPQTCGGGGTPNVCGGCTPTTCAAQGKNCGTIADGCGGTLDCGTCGQCLICSDAYPDCGAFEIGCNVCVSGGLGLTGSFCRTGTGASGTCCGEHGPLCGFPNGRECTQNSECCSENCVASVCTVAPCPTCPGGGGIIG